MKALTELTITNSDYSLDHGFFWVEFESGKSLQCCLKDGQKMIESGNCGHDEGLSHDCNGWAVDEGLASWDEIEMFLIDQARKIGVQIVA